MRQYTSAAALSLLELLFLAGCVPNSVDNFADWPVDASRYEIEELPVDLSASYVRGGDVYFGLPDGEIRKASDSQIGAPLQNWGQPLDTGPRLLFAAKSGTVFVSADQRPLIRTADGGQSWQTSLDVSVWRMDEDDEGGLYAGNYTHDEHIATLYKSTDDGLTWATIWTDPANQHIHTVRWDDADKRLYISFGDAATRGRADSDDRGATFQIIARDYHDGPTDVAFTRDFVFWGTDSGLGELWRVSRATGEQARFLGGSQYLWFTVAAGEQLYVGTVTSATDGGERAALLATPDQGASWFKLLETDLSTGPYTCGFSSESRVLSAGGWLYCTGGAAGATKSYRVRLRTGQ